jgi:hypothetical protein
LKKQGTDLRRLLQDEGALEPSRALQLLTQLANALDAAHERGLVHRDVKPSNALLDSAGHLYLADFGLTKGASDRSVLPISSRISGTVDYVAPEQIEGRSVDGRADVYSLGCMLYECLTGEVPFLRNSELAVLWGHVNEPPPKASERDPHLPEAIDPVIARALAKSPEERYETCRDLTEAAREAAGLRDVVVLRDRRPLLLAALGALVAAAALTAGVVLALRGGGSPKPNLTVTNQTLVRINPHANKIDAVTRVGRPLRTTVGPVGLAVGGKRPWVYNWDEGTVRAIDSRTAIVDRTVRIRGLPPVGQTNPIAADATGAWALSSDARGGLVTHVRPGIEFPREFSFDYAPLAVAVGKGAVWISAKNASGSAVLRVSPTTGAVLTTVPLRGALNESGDAFLDNQSIAVGAGAVWVAWGRRIFRIDPSSGRITGRVNLPAKQIVQLAAGSGRAPGRSSRRFGSRGR